MREIFQKTGGKGGPKIYIYPTSGQRFPSRKTQNAKREAIIFFIQSFTFARGRARLFITDFFCFSGSQREKSVTFRNNWFMHLCKEIVRPNFRRKFSLTTENREIPYYLNLVLISQRIRSNTHSEEGVVNVDVKSSENEWRTRRERERESEWALPASRQNTTHHRPGRPRRPPPPCRCSCSCPGSLASSSSPPLFFLLRNIHRQREREKEREVD